MSQQFSYGPKTPPSLSLFVLFPFGHSTYKPDLLTSANDLYNYRPKTPPSLSVFVIVPLRGNSTETWFANLRSWKGSALEMFVFMRTWKVALRWLTAVVGITAVRHALICHATSCPFLPCAPRLTPAATPSPSSYFGSSTFPFVLFQQQQRLHGNSGKIYRPPFSLPRYFMQSLLVNANLIEPLPNLPAD